MESQSSNALHVAAALGLPNFVREIVDKSPELALGFDEHGLTPCHLAMANGHKSVVKELLISKVGIDICYLRDKGGFLPVHTAVMKGRVDLLKVVNDTCCMDMLKESTWQGDNILHLALKFNSLEAFCYLWHFLSGDKQLINSGDVEGNTILHLAVARRQQEIVNLLIGKVDLDVINQNGSTALGNFFNTGHEDEDMTVDETSNTLMIVSTLIAALTFQSALNPPGGFIQDGKDSGMAVMERYLFMYLLFDVMAFICSLSVNLLTIYAVPKWKDLLKLAKFIVWLSVFFTYTSFQYAIAAIFGHVIRHPLISASLYFGDGIILTFAFFMFVYSWCLLHKGMSSFFQARLTGGTIGRSKIVAITCLSFFGAALVWLPIVILDITRFYMWLT